MLNPDQALAVPKAQFTAIATLGQRWLDCSEQLAALQLRTGRNALSDCAAFIQELLEVRSPEQLLAICNATAGQMAAKSEAYGRSLQEIANSANTSWNQFFGEQATDAQKQIGTLIQSTLQNVPQDPDNAAALFRQAISTATTTIESLQKAAMQAVEVTDANLKAVTSTASRKTPGTGE